MATERQAQSLVEIFKVLCVTVQYMKDEEANAAGSAPIESNPVISTVDKTTEEIPSTETKRITPPKSLYSSIVASLYSTESDSGDEEDKDQPASPTGSIADPTSIPASRLSQDKAQPNVSVVELPDKGKESKLEIKEDSMLDLTMADAKFLNPEVLSTAITKVLQSFVKQKKTEINAVEFADRVQKMMFAGSLPPIGYLLTKSEKRMARKSQHSYVSHEELELKHCKEKPDLKAAKITNELTKARYRRRHEGDETIFESLRNCKTWLYLLFNTLLFL
jgi:hypothetical protein